MSSAYNNFITMGSLFANASLKSILPQFPKNQPLTNALSSAEILRRVRVYLQGALGGRLDHSGDTNDLVVRGQHTLVLQKTRQLAKLIEKFFCVYPQVAFNVANNTRLYTQYASVAHIKELASGKVNIQAKIELMQCVLDNINYNQDFNSENSITRYKESKFLKEQKQWAKQVGCLI